jgi:hypothetical protein
MPKTYEPIATNTLGSAAASVTFSSIPSTYTDLVLVTVHTNATGSNNTLTLQFNGDTTSNYSRTAMYGDGTTAGSFRTTNESGIFTGFAASNSDITQTNIQIQNYSNATTFKTVLTRSTVPAGQTRATVSLWRKTPESINSILIYTASGTFSAGSTFTLYGIKAA